MVLTLAGRDAAPHDVPVLRVFAQRLRHVAVEAWIRRPDAGRLRQRRIDVRLQDRRAKRQHARVIHVRVHAERLPVMVQACAAVPDIRDVEHHVGRELMLVGHGPVLEARQRHPIARDRDDVGVVLQARVDERRSEDEVLREPLVEMEGWRDPVGRCWVPAGSPGSRWLADRRTDRRRRARSRCRSRRAVHPCRRRDRRSPLADPTRPWGCPRTSACPPARHLTRQKSGRPEYYRRQGSACSDRTSST